MRKSNQTSRPHQPVRNAQAFSLPARIRSGGQDSEKLYQDLAEPLHRFACRWTGSDDDAKDMVQDAFIGVHRNLHAFRGKSRRGGNAGVRTWIYTITRNGCYHLHERQRTHREKEAELAQDIGLAGAAQRNVERDRASAWVERLLRLADNRTRLILQLIFLEGCTQMEVAQKLKISRQTIWKAIIRFRELVLARVEQPSDLQELWEGSEAFEHDALPAMA